METAKSVCVDRGNLSRFLRQAEGSGLSSEKAASVLQHLGWGQSGPISNVVHRWRLDDLEDVQWVFKNLLAGSVSVSPLFRDFQSAELLGHQGLLLGQWGGTWLVLSQRLVKKGSSSTSGADLLGDLLDARKLLAKSSGIEVLEDAAAFTELEEGRVSPAGVANALRRPAVAVIAQEARELVHEHSKLWLTPERLRILLEDGLTRLARHEPESLISSMLDEMLEWWRDRNQASPTRSTVDTCRRVVEKNVAGLAARSFHLEWSLSSEAPRPPAESMKSKLRGVDRKRRT